LLKGYGIRASAGDVGLVGTTPVWRDSSVA